MRECNRAVPLHMSTAAAAPGASLDFSLAPGEILEVEEQLVVSGITVSISSAEPGATISRAAWANNSRIFEVRDGGHLLLAQVVAGAAARTAVGVPRHEIVLKK